MVEPGVESGGDERRAEARFIADAMLGSLARWMRTLGCDVEYSSTLDDAGVVDRAVSEDRIILTRDTGLIKRRKARGRFLFIESDFVADQLRQVAGSFSIPRSPSLVRCLRCNTPLERAEKESVAHRVPPYVYKTQDEFSICPSCRRVYWAGTHRHRMEDDVARMLGGGPPDKPG